MGLTDVVKNQQRRLRLVGKRTFRRIRVWLVPAPFLSPIDRFRKAGHNHLIYRSAAVPHKGSVVIFGGYLGDSIAGWLEKNETASIYGYEPVPEFFAKLKERFTTENVHLFQFGVGKRDEVRVFSLLDDATSGDSWRALKLSREIQAQSIPVEFRTPSRLREAWPAMVDVMEINIEGGEYELLEVLADSKLLRQVRQVFVQFHDIGESTEESLAQARRTLQNSHRQVWCFELVWEFWELKDIPSS